MQQAVDLILQLGQFAMLVIAVCVAAMLLISIIDRHPRDKRSGDDRDRTE
jgi:hypothetical protein